MMLLDTLSSGLTISKLKTGYPWKYRYANWKNKLPTEMLRENTMARRMIHLFVKWIPTPRFSNLVMTMIPDINEEMDMNSADMY